MSRKSLGNLIAIGVDIVEVERVAGLIAHGAERLSRIFTPCELTAPSMSLREYLARSFAVKEAMFKALGRGWGQGMRWGEVATRRVGKGCTRVTLSGRAARRLRAIGGSRVDAQAFTVAGHAFAQVYIWG
ncbi:MAG: 4'-phosphopantetheinyl transferase superfamily protein [Candidatus Aureabacteria bacterium]|nr:4'-phosphopantetheinyl transferase superfamily protein [Candidatus Auribacterota bacterium]